MKQTSVILSKTLMGCAAALLLAATGCETTEVTKTAAAAPTQASAVVTNAATKVQTAASTASSVATTATTAATTTAAAVTAPAGQFTGTPPALRIKAGAAEPFKDSAGNVWKADDGFEGGSTVDRDAGTQIANTKDSGLFVSEHYSMDSFSAKVPNGKYSAKLYFAETYEGIQGAGQRVFTFKVQDSKEFKDFDVFVKAGGANRAYVETVPVEVTTGVFKITFTPNVENPEINAIELIPQ